MHLSVTIRVCLIAKLSLVSLCAFVCSKLSMQWLMRVVRMSIRSRSTATTMATNTSIMNMPKRPSMATCNNDGHKNSSNSAVNHFNSKNNINDTKDDTKDDKGVRREELPSKNKTAMCCALLKTAPCRVQCSDFTRHT